MARLTAGILRLRTSACCAVIAYYFWFVSSYAINVPHHDDIYDFLQVVNLIESADSAQAAFKEGFRQFVEGIYKPDHTPSARIKRKYKVMAKRDPLVRTFEVIVENPTIIKHKKTRLKGQTFCKEMKNLKHDIREEYLDSIPDYTHDVIIHISDNNDHNKIISKLLKKCEKV